MQRGFKARALTSASALAAACAAFPIGAHAQTQLEELIVTAGKREQSLQDVAGAVSALSEQTMAIRGIKNLEDISQQAPGMTFYTMSGSTFITLRGVGVPVDTGASDPNTAVNVDGVNLPRAGEATLDLYDVQRVEVARGPQGTLYGRNAIGGAINFISKAPTKDFQADVTAGVGNYESYVVHGAVSGPITDQIAGRLSASVSGREKGYVKNLWPGGDRMDRSRSWSLRGSLAVELTPDVRVDFSAQTQFQKFDSFQQPMGGTIVVPGAIGAAPGSGAIIPAYQTPGLLISLDPWTIYSAFTHWSQKRTTILTGTVNWDITPDIKFKSITGYVDYTFDSSLDGGGYVPTYGILPSPQDAKREGYPFGRHQPSQYLSQEFNIAGTFGKGGSWVVGLFASTENYKVDIPISLPTFVGYTTNPGNPAASSDTWINFFADYKEQTTAVFADVTLPVTDRFRVYGGARYARERNRAQYLTSLIIYPNLFANPAVNIPVTDGCQALSGGVFSNADDYDFRWHPFSPRAGAQFDFTPNIMGYVQWSKGFKQGGTAATLCGNTYKPERMTAYEAGVKSTFFDGRLVANVSLYHYDYSGLQIYQGIGTAQAQVVNADARIDGLDVEVTARLTEHISVDVAGNILGDEFKDFASVDASDPLNTRGLPTVLVNGIPTPNLDGHQLPGVPNYNVTTGLEGSFPVELGVFNSVLVRGEANFVGRTDIAGWKRPETIQKAFIKLNAVVAFQGDEGWTLRFWGRNLTDEDTTYHFLWNGGANIWSGQYAPPRTFGVEVTKEF